MTACTSPQFEETKLIIRKKDGKLVKAPVQMLDDGERIHFMRAPFVAKDEIKAMKGSKWDHENKVWSIESCPRNRFQLDYLTGKNPYEWFDRGVSGYEYDRDLMEHQKVMTDNALTYRWHIWAAEMGVGKTLSAQEVIERSGHNSWFWIGPKSVLPNIEREFRKWNMDPSIKIEFFTYEGLVRYVDEWEPGDPLPRGVVMDESSKVKTASSQRSRACQRLADRMRDAYGHECYVLLMSGTPSPKSPLDWWSQCEIACPGFLREGSDRALEKRLAFMVEKQFEQGIVQVRDGWKDDEAKCAKCGRYADAACHTKELATATDEEYHPWKSSSNEVAYMHERLKGLVTVMHKKDCLTLPEKRYRAVNCDPKPSVLRVAKVIAQSSPNAITAMTHLRELSDGFQYREKQDGTMKCNLCDGTGQVYEWLDPSDEERNYRDISILPEEYAATLQRIESDCPKCGGSSEMARMKREVIEVPCPKEQALKDELKACEETGRIVIAAGFTGSIDRVVRICHKEKWNVVRLDSRGYYVEEHDGNVVIDTPALDYWADNPSRVAFVMHPESGGMGLTLTEARVMVYWSNSFKPEYRIQSEDRIHRKGMDENLGCEIVDLLHLPTDTRTLEVIRANRKLELMTMGEVAESIGVEN